MKPCLKHAQRANVVVFLAVSSFSVTLVFAQDTPAEPASREPSLADPSSALPGFDEPINDRIFGVIPNYLTVENPELKVRPLTPKEKFNLFAKETVDPFTFVASAAGAALSQIDNDNPKYGHGAGPYAERFGAAMADVTTQNFFSDVMLATLLHEDPRYFRRGPEFRFWYRVGYALSRVVVTRTDKGTDRFNYSGILGMSMGIALSNAYYPDASVNASEVGYRFGTSLAASALANILPEFWPDIHEKFSRPKSRKPNPGALPPGP